MAVLPTVKVTVNVLESVTCPDGLEMSAPPVAVTTGAGAPVSNWKPAGAFRINVPAPPVT